MSEHAGMPNDVVGRLLQTESGVAQLPATPMVRSAQGAAPFYPDPYILETAEYGSWQAARRLPMEEDDADEDASVDLDDDDDFGSLGDDDDAFDDESFEDDFEDFDDYDDDDEEEEEI